MAEDSPLFGRRISIEQVEEGHTLAPRFDRDGLIPVVTTDADTGELLMHGYMNAAALAKTIETTEAYYYSRSRKAIWHKGATSGLTQKVIEMRIDDDQDAVWLRVKVPGPAPVATSAIARAFTGPCRSVAESQKPSIISGSPKTPRPSIRRWFTATPPIRRNFERQAIIASSSRGSRTLRN